MLTAPPQSTRLWGVLLPLPANAPEPARFGNPATAHHVGSFVRVAAAVLDGTFDTSGQFRQAGCGWYVWISPPRAAAKNQHGVRNADSLSGFRPNSSFPNKRGKKRRGRAGPPQSVVARPSRSHRGREGQRRKKLPAQAPVARTIERGGVIQPHIRRKRRNVPEHSLYLSWAGCRRAAVADRICPVERRAGHHPLYAIAFV